jgi:O-acetyl-ADP-ribose deacetylase (regulator of RNase III)
VRRFKLTTNTELVLESGDITRVAVDAIVNAANERMLGGGGVDGAIHRAAGPALREACAAVCEVRPGVRCPTGEARITPGFRLPARFVIHTVGPVYRGAESAALLESAYRSCLAIAAEHALRSIAFPAISCGVYGYPLDDAAQIALDTTTRHARSLAAVHFVLFGAEPWAAWLAATERMLLPVE